MKVLHVIPSIAPVRGGPSQAVLQMVRALRQRGVEADIATTNDNGPDVLDVPLNRWIEYPVHRDTIPVQVFQRFSPAIAPLREFAFSSGLTHWLGQNLSRYDVVHVHAIFSYPSTVAMAMARAQKVPYIVRPLGQLCHWSLQQGQRKKRLYLNVIERANLKASVALHCTSEQEQTEAQRVDPSFRSFVVPHGLEMPSPIPDVRQQLRAKLAIAPGEPIITFLSRLHPKKGLNELISALGMLKSYPFQIVIAGTGNPDYEAEIELLLRQEGLHVRTHRLGFVSGAYKDLVLQGSDLFALTSHSENFGIAVLEALAAGVPVLTTPGVALSSLVDQHRLGWVVDHSVPAIARGLRYALEQPDTLTQKGDRARQVVQQQFTWPSIANRLIDHYKRAVSSSLPSDAP